MNRFAKWSLVSLLSAIVLSIGACGRGGRGGNSSGGGGGSSHATPTVTVTPAASSITAAQSLAVSIAVTGSSGTPTGSVVLSSGSYTSAAATLTAGSASITIPAGSLATGSVTLTANYTSDAASTSVYNSASGTAAVTVTQAARAPTVTVTPDATTLPFAQSLVVTVKVGGSGAAPTGPVALSSGSYTSASTNLNSGSATIYVLPGSLATGSATLTATYTPDSSSSSSYTSATGTAEITVTAPGSTNVSVNIDTRANRHQISPFVYGNNESNPSIISDVGYSFARWGGNDASNYNWKLGTRNSAGDWYFEDYGGAGDSVKFVTDVQNSGSHALMTMAMMDWVAKESGNWSFSVKTFGPQCSVDPYNADAGNGLQTDCKTPVTTEAVTTAYYPLLDSASQGCSTGNCVYRDEWAKALAAAFESETCPVPYSPIASCHFYDMDNEVDIWDGTHRDVHPVKPGYDELANLFEKEASNLKTWDPAAVRFGPVSCCWWFYWNVGPSGDDKGAHGGVDFLPWWLNQVYWLDKINGARTLDVFDIHAYADSGGTNGFNDQQLRAATAKVARYYWDPATAFADLSSPPNTSMLVNYAIPFVIPRFKAMVNAIYPGTPLAFTEWGAGLAPNSGWDFSTAIADADTYGAFGREGLSFASRWGGPSAGDPNYQAVKLYTNYDGPHHQFGTLSISAQNSGSPDLFTSYAALDSTGTTMTIMVLNKDDSNSANVTFNINGFTPTTYTAYTLASTSSSAIKISGLASWSATQTFAPYSITLLVVSGTQTSKPAAEWYLNPDDLMIPASGTGTLHPQIASGTSPVTLTAAVFDAYEGAAACNGTLTLTNATITASTPATITVSPGSTSGFCHYTVTGNDGTATQTEGGWIVVGKPGGTLTVQSGNNQSGSAGTVLSQALTVALDPGQSGGSKSGAGILFTTSAGTLSNGTTSGSGVLAQTNSSGVASVSLTLPSTGGTVTVTAQSQFALGGASVTFTESAN
ncbi:MAG TPA: glycoside hydrolase family 44 protein [Bryobacteraceae bacterium]|nr:glycoside hydrolase family 44 protein [Bryobacteraceae bacterium]